MKRVIFAAIMLLFALNLVQAAILYVDKAGTTPYTEIQPAINAASAGDTIAVAASFNTYEGFTVDRYVHIIGAGTDTLPGQATKINGSVQVAGSADNTLLRSLWIFGSINHSDDSIAAILRIGSGAQGIQVSGCYIENEDTGWWYAVYCVWIGRDAEATIVACGLKMYVYSEGTCIKLTSESSTAVLNVSNSIMLRGGISGGSTGSVVSVRNCVIHKQGSFIYTSNAGGTVVNTVCIMNQGSPFFGGAPNFTASYCATQGIVPGGPGNISANVADFEHWVDYDLFRSNYHLSASSALRDAGDPITPPDLDGSRADIGVYGGQTPYVYFGLPDFPIVTSLEVPVSVPQNGILHIGSRGRVGQGDGE